MTRSSQEPDPVLSLGTVVQNSLANFTVTVKTTMSNENCILHNYIRSTNVMMSFPAKNPTHRPEAEFMSLLPIFVLCQGQGRPGMAPCVRRLSPGQAPASFVWGGLAQGLSSCSQHSASEPSLRAEGCAAAGRTGRGFVCPAQHWAGRMGVASSAPPSPEEGWDMALPAPPSPEQEGWGVALPAPPSPEPRQYEVHSTKGCW